MKNKVKKEVIIAPSVLSADYGNLKKELNTIKKYGAQWIHFDVMDGDFVPNLTFGPKILADIRKISDLYIDCHMMVNIKNRTVEEYFTPFLEAGCNSFTVHYEAFSKSQLKELYNFKQKHGCKIGIAISPQTSFSKIAKIIDNFDIILIMTVNPGFGGQGFIEQSAQKIKEAKEFIVANNLNVLIQVDGGINDKTAKICKNLGANILVAGSYLFGQKDIKQRMESLIYD